ncbi:MAG: DNA polymerase III subunit beta [bacterium]|nr:DNA polymerase III subunit beta [bacterium]
MEEEGELTIPARLVNDYVNNIAAEKITITTQNQTLFLEAERAKTHIKGLSSDEFPLIPKAEEKIYTKIEGKLLGEVIKKVSFASAFSETQPEISGVLFFFEGKTLTMAATDRYRLAEAKIELLEEVASPKSVIIPARGVNEVARVVGQGPIDIYLTDGQVVFKTEDTELLSRLIDGQYPDYKQIIPKSFVTEAEMGRNEFVQALKAASLFASESNNIELDLTPQNKQVVIKSQSSQTGDSEIRLDAKITGQKNSVVFNYRYIIECLNNLPDEKIVLKAIDSSSPAQIVPVGRDNYLYIVMPIKI